MFLHLVDFQIGQVLGDTAGWGWGLQEAYFKSQNGQVGQLRIEGSGLVLEEQEVFYLEDSFIHNITYFLGYKISLMT